MIINKETKAVGLFLMKEMFAFVAALAISLTIGASLPESMMVGSCPAGLLVAACVYAVAMMVAQKTRWARLPNQ